MIKTLVWVSSPIFQMKQSTGLEIPELASFLYSVVLQLLNRCQAFILESQDTPGGYPGPDR